MEETIRGGKKYTENTGYGGRRGRAGIGGQADRAGTQKEKKKRISGTYEVLLTS